MDYIISDPDQIKPADFAKELRNIKFKEALINFLIEHLIGQKINWYHLLVSVTR